MVYRAYFSGRASSGEEMEFYCRVRIVVSYSVSNYLNFFPFSFQIRTVSGAALRAKFGTNLWKTLRNPMKELSFVSVGGLLRSGIASVA